MAIVGLTVSESVVVSPSLDSGGITEYTIIGLSSGLSANQYNKLIGANDYLQFATKVPGADEIVKAEAKAFFANHPNGRISFFPAHDDTETGSDEPAIVNHLRKGLSVLASRQDLDLRYFSIPRLAALSSQSDRSTIYSAAHTTALTRDWIFLVGSSDGITDKDAAIAERNLYSAPLGHACYYYGRVTNNDDVEHGLASIVAAIAVRRSLEDGSFKPAAGARYPVQSIKSVQYYVDNAADYKELQDNQINVLQLVPIYGYCVWGARTLSKDRNLAYINTRAAASKVKRNLETSLLPLLFESADPQGFNNREIERVINSVLQAAWLEGAFSQATAEQSYRIAEEEVIEDSEGTEVTTEDAASTTTAQTATPVARSLRKVVLKIYASFVGAIEEIEVKLFHSSDISVFNAESEAEVL